MNKIIIAVDFDDTLVYGIPYPQMDYVLKPYAKEVINRLTNKGFQFVLNTARYGWWRLPAILFIKKEKLPIICHLYNKKERAKLYIDDKNLECNGIDWLEIEKIIERKFKK